MQPGLLSFLVWFGGWFVLLVVFLVAQHVFYRESRRTHGLWRPPSEQSFGPTWQELSAMGSATFRKQEDRDAEKARRRYLAVMAFVVGWMFLGLPAAFVLEAVLRRLINWVA
jgi:hypothetical protein